MIFFKFNFKRISVWQINYFNKVYFWLMKLPWKCFFFCFCFETLSSFLTQSAFMPMKAFLLCCVSCYFFDFDDFLLGPLCCCCTKMNTKFISASAFPPSSTSSDWMKSSKTCFISHLFDISFTLCCVFDLKLKARSKAWTYWKICSCKYVNKLSSVRKVVEKVEMVFDVIYFDILFR